MAARFCPACGTSVLDASDTYCGNCGSALARSGPPAAPPPSSPPSSPRASAASVPAFAPVAAATPTGSPAFVPAYAPPPYPPSAYPPSASGVALAVAPDGPAATLDTPDTPKSAGLALVLEVLVPGAGALYAGQAWRGIAWLVGTVVGLMIGVVLLDGMHPLRSSILGVAYLAWIVVRCVLVSDLVETRNARARREPAPPLYSTGGATGATICAILVALLLGSLVLFAQNASGGAVAPIAFWGWAVIAAYWVALCRLPRAGAWRVCVETLGWNLLLFGVVDVALLVLVRGALAARGISPLRARSLAITQDLAIGRVAVEVAVAGLLGFAFALIYARWSGVRGLPGERRATGGVALALLVTGVVALGYFGLLLALAGRLETPRVAALAVVWAIGVPVIAWVALPWYAGWRALRLLRASAPVQPTAPLVAPVPPPAPAIWPR